MNTKNIFKAVALAMLMPAMLLTTACSNQDDVANTSNITNKGYALPVTVNATRGDGATRASFDGSKLNFSAGDKLFVKGNHETAGKFAGTLDYDAGSGKFSGTIYTKNLYEGTAEELLSAASSVFAILLPAGYNNYDFLTLNTNNGYDATISTDLSKTFALTKAAAVEQFSSEMTYSYSNGFILSPWYGILNFTITGLTPNTDVYVTFSDYTPNGNTMGGIVHTDGSGNATDGARRSFPGAAVRQYQYVGSERSQLLPPPLWQQHPAVPDGPGRSARQPSSGIPSGRDCQ